MGDFTQYDFVPNRRVFTRALRFLLAFFEVMNLGLLIEADLHTHTLVSNHAYSTLKENCASAAAVGLKAIAMTDHSPGTPDGAHILHFINQRTLPRTVCDVTVLRGAEVNITDSTGALDMEERHLAPLEWVVASMHNRVMNDHTREGCTAAYLAVAENPLIDVIGHCTTDSFPFDMEPCLKKFKEYEKLVEINESSVVYRNGSLQNSIEVLRLCKRYEIPIVIDSDCHFCDLIGLVPAAEQLIEGTGFPKRLIINADWERVRKFVQKRHPGIDI